MRILIIGNGGSGKTWLARRIADAVRLPVIHLDDMHWEPGHTGIARDRTLRDDSVRTASLGDGWIMEGVYGQLAHIVLGRVTSLIWLDLPVEQCVANAAARGMQGGETEAQFHDLLKWIVEYKARPKNWNSFDTHLRQFNDYSGPKFRLTGRAEINAYLEGSQ